MKDRVDVDVFGCDVEQHNKAELAPCPYCEIDRLREALKKLSACEDDSSWGVWVREIAKQALQLAGGWE